MKKKIPKETFRNPFLIPAKQRKAGEMKSHKKDNYIKDDDLLNSEDNMGPTSYALAAEIDRQHKLNLDNIRFNKLVEYLEAAPDNRAKANELMRAPTKTVLAILDL